MRVEGDAAPISPLMRNAGFWYFSMNAARAGTAYGGGVLPCQGEGARKKEGLSIGYQSKGPDWASGGKGTSMMQVDNILNISVQIFFRKVNRGEKEF